VADIFIIASIALMMLLKNYTSIFKDVNLVRLMNLDGNQNILLRFLKGLKKQKG